MTYIALLRRRTLFLKLYIRQIFKTYLPLIRKSKGKTEENSFALYCESSTKMSEQVVRLSQTNAPEVSPRRDVKATVFLLHSFR